MSEESLVGTCKWFDTKKGFGFLQVPGNALDYFVHADQLRKSGITQALIEGQKVRFCFSIGPKGQFAHNLSLVKE